MDMVPQGYPLFATFKISGADSRYMATVVGWAADESPGRWLPVVVTPTSGRAIMVSAECLYLGPDRSAAVAACRPEAPSDAARDTQTAARRSPAVRYAPGATALCGLLNAHEPHLWTPDDHDFAIRCTGGTP